MTDIYRTRWRIETGFQKLEAYLHSAINTLGYPKAALFGFCLALVAFNLYAVVMAAIRAAHPDRPIDDGIMIAVPDTDWLIFAQASTPLWAQMMRQLAQQIDLRKFKKHKRGPKKKSKPKTKYLGKPHVSTAKLLAQNV